MGIKTRKDKVWNHIQDMQEFKNIVDYISKQKDLTKTKSNKFSIQLYSYTAIQLYSYTANVEKECRSG